MIHFFAPGEPVAKARAKARIVKPKHGKAFVQMYTPADTVNYEKYIAGLAQQQMLLREPTKAPVKLDLILFFEIPKSWPEWKRQAALTKHIAHTTKPDSDNVTKAIKDALNGVVWSDDAQVCQINVNKLYSTEPGVLIDVTELTLMAPAQITRKSDFKPSGQQELVA